MISNGRDARRFQPARKEEFVFSAGRLWDAAKNLAVLDRAAPDLPWPVIVAGDARHPDGGELRPRNARFLGRLSPDDVAAWLGRAAIYALPARYEPFGLSALEAALSGCALVLGDIPSLREVWGDAACFAEPEDPGALAAAIRRLTSDSALRESFSELARRRALELSPRPMASRYLDAYALLVAECSVAS